MTLVSKLNGFPLANVQVFLSGDLGSTSPTQADLAILVPKTARIAGWSALPPLNADGLREVNIFTLTFDQLDEGTEAFAEASALSPLKAETSPTRK